MNEEMLNLQKQIKENITSLVNAGKIDAAKPLISEYESIIQNDVEIYSIKAVIAIMGNRLQDAENLLKRGLIIDSNNFDLNYNLAYVYSTMQDYNQAFKYYKKSAELCKDENIKSEINDSIESILKDHKKEIKEERKRLTL